MANKEQKTVSDFFENARSVEFLIPENEKEIPSIFITFEDMRMAAVLYTEVVRVNKIREQYLGFQKASSSLIISVILKQTDETVAGMLLDYNENEFDAFVKHISPTTKYMVLFGQYRDKGIRQIASPINAPDEHLMFDKYKY